MCPPPFHVSKKILSKQIKRVRFRGAVVDGISRWKGFFISQHNLSVRGLTCALQKYFHFKKCLQSFLLAILIFEKFLIFDEHF